jgi:hypothetical protein
MEQPAADSDMLYAHPSTSSEYTTNTYQHLNKQYSTLDIHHTDADDKTNDAISSSSSSRDMAPSETVSSHSAYNVETHGLPEYFSVVSDKNYLQPVDDNEAYLQPVCGSVEHSHTEIGNKHSVNPDNTGSDHTQTLSDLPGYTMNDDSTDGFVCINYADVQRNEAPIFQTAHQESYYQEIADEQTVYDEINMDYQQVRDVHTYANDNTAVILSQDQHEDLNLQPTTVNKDRRYSK